MKVLLHNIPRSLKTSGGARFGLNQGKVPCKADGSNAKSNDPETWSEWNEIERAYAKKVDFGYGVSIFLGGEYVCLDFDKVRDPDTGKITNETAQEILDEIEGIGYAEVSRSGTGVHVFMRIDDWSREDRYVSEVDLGGGAQLEIFFSKRHICLTGNTEGFDGWDIGHVCQPAWDWVCENYALKPETTQRREGTAKLTEGLSRILKGYCNEILANHRQKEGGRDNWLFRAGSGVADRCGRDLGTVSHWVHRFNEQCCEPPLAPEDCDRIARSCCENSETRLIPVKEYENPIPILDVDQMEAEAAEAWAEELIFNLTKTFKYGQIRNGSGFIPEFMRYCHENGDRPTEELDFASAISVFGALIADKARVGKVDGGTRPNLTVIATADSGIGKDYGRKLGMSVLRKVGLAGRVHGAKVSSGQGIYTLLAEGDPCMWFPLDEFADTLGDNTKMSPQAQSIGEAVKLTYSADGDNLKPNGKADSSQNVEIKGCAPSYYINSTGEAFWNSFSLASASDGFLGRVIYFDCPTRKKRPLGDQSKKGIYQRPEADERLLAMAQQWIEYNPIFEGINEAFADGYGDPSELVPEWHLTEEARSLFLEFDREIDNKGCSEPTPATPLWRRCTQNILKMSLIFAASRLGPEGKRIETEDMQLAISVIKAQVYAVSRKLIEDAADSDTIKLANRLRRRFEKHGKPATTGYFKRWGIRADERDINAALKTLITEGSLFYLGDSRYVAKTCYDKERDGGVQE